MTIRWGRRGRRLAAGAAAAVLLLLVLDALFPFPEDALRRRPSLVVEDREGAPLRIFLSRDEKYRIPVGLDEISPEMARAIVASEDRWFRWHPGVNPAAVLRALWTNARAGRIVSGASTLPMQVARLAEPKARTLRGKIVQTLRALQLSWHHSKDEILELYLNNAPYGGNIEGIGAASWFYFGVTPERLSIAQAALLTALPRSPAALDPSQHPAAARRARDRVLDHLAATGVLDARSAAAASAQPVPAVKRPPPFAAPHFAQLVADQDPDGARIVTTLDRRSQRLAEEQVAAHIAALRARGLGNAAVVVIENATRCVRALVGSAGFGETYYQGQVDGALARRSPGSALKPFLYAMAIDQGTIVPESLLLDVPTDFAGYVAENYDGEYRGPVTAREALVNSLNAPAVRLLARAGLPEFVALLRRGGLTTLDRPAAKYGLPIILGSGEVTLLDLANLYATLAEGGLHKPFRLAAVPPAPGERILSAEAASLVTEMLTGLRRPDLPAAWDLTRDVPAVAWKTGTSYGHRDAWAVGFSSRTTIGVWVGNPDGRGQKGISGAEHAAPLLFDLFRAIEGGRTSLPEHPGVRIERVKVCALSRELPGPFCPKTETIEIVGDRTILHPCRMHRRIFVDAASGERLAGACLGLRPHVARTVVAYPDELLAFWRSQGRPVAALPALDATCRDIPSEDPPRIVSPAGTTPYRLRRDAPSAFQRIPLIARASAEAERLWWYQDGVLVASGAPSRSLFLDPRRGSHRIVVVDGAGRSDALTYTVE